MGCVVDVTRTVSVVACRGEDDDETPWFAVAASMVLGARKDGSLRRNEEDAEGEVTLTAEKEDSKLPLAGNTAAA